MLATSHKPCHNARKTVRSRRTSSEQRLFDLLDRLMPPAMDGTLDRDWEAAAHELGRCETDYLYHESFADSGTTEEILAAEPIRAEPVLSCWKPGRDMPAHLARLCETPLLSPGEESHLFRRMNYLKYRADLLRRQIDPDAPDRQLIPRIERLLALALWDRNRIVRANLRLVVSIARKFADLRNPFDDLLSEGITSLLKAAQKFDFSRGFRFSTYATMAVRRTIYRLVQHNHRERTRFRSDEGKLLDAVPEDNSTSSRSETRWEELNNALGLLLGRLDAREQIIIRNRFGLEENREVKTLQALAAEMGVCKERVRQLEMRAIVKLRGWAEQIRLTPPDES